MAPRRGMPRVKDKAGSNRSTREAWNHAFARVSGLLFVLDVATDDLGDVGLFLLLLFEEGVLIRDHRLRLHVFHLGLLDRRRRLALHFGVGLLERDQFSLRLRRLDFGLRP